MKAYLLPVVALSCATVCEAAEFQSPVRLKAGDKAIRVESPGYACPTWANVDGKPALVVGQFAGGKMRVYPHQGDLQFGEGKWLEVGGKPAEVPGVW
ncbi:MAG: hypothetical protein ACKO23_04115, partial [Gemmataceae bacterium]